MAPKSGDVVFAFVCVLAVGVPILCASRIGGWQPIENPNDDKAVVAVAKVAVEEYNKQHGQSLVFESVVKGDMQVVAGVKYRLLISASSANYAAVVWAKLDKTIELISFEKDPMPSN